MLYSLEETHLVQANLNSFLEEKGAYGHFKDNSFVVINSGNICEFTIYKEPFQDKYDIRQIYGDRLEGNSILQKLLNRRIHTGLCESFSEINMDEIEKYFAYEVENIETQFWTKYGRETITGLAKTMSQFRNIPEFVELYHAKYKESLHKSLIQLFDKTQQEQLIIPLLELLKQVMEYESTDEYIDILKSKMESKTDENSISKYIAIIASDIYNQFNTLSL